MYVKSNTKEVQNRNPTCVPTVHSQIAFRIEVLRTTYANATFQSGIVKWWVNTRQVNTRSISSEKYFGISLFARSDPQIPPNLNKSASHTSSSLGTESGRFDKQSHRKLNSLPIPKTIYSASSFCKPSWCNEEPSRYAGGLAKRLALLCCLIIVCF